MGDFTKVVSEFINESNEKIHDESFLDWLDRTDQTFLGAEDLDIIEETY